MSELALLPAGPIGYGLCVAAYVVVAVLGALSRLEGARKLLFVSASLLTGFWAASGAFGGFGLIVDFGEILRSLAWITFVAAVLNVDYAKILRRRRSALRFVPFAVVVALAAIALVLLWSATSLPGSIVYIQMLLSIAALLLLENIYRNCNAEIRWGVKNICFGLGAIFVYDFYYFTSGVLTLRFDPSLEAARGYVAVLAVPFLLLAIRRGRSWRRDISISRQVVFHSAVLLACGAYLLAMSLAGTVLRSIGGNWGPVLQAIFLVAAILGMLAAFSSATARGTLRVLVSKHFYRHKYDYREVWLNFIQKMSREDGTENLHRRTLGAVADIFDCPAGALWVYQAEDEAYFPTAVWNFGQNLPVVGADNALVRFLESRAWIVNLGEYKRSTARYDGLEIPRWLLDHTRAWIVIPLIHGNRLQAFLILGTPRTPATLGWEEFDLMKTVGAQAASYLAEESMSRALVDARRLADFNQRFAFVIHDIKNVVSQMSLMMSNADRHGDDPEFQSDMLLTVNSSIDRLRKMLAQLSAQKTAATENAPLELVPFLRERVGRWRLNYDNLGADGLGAEGMSGETTVLANGEKLGAVLDHLIQNAIEASPDGERVEIALRTEGSEAVVSIRDRGQGMDAEFVRTQLFRPLDTWKPQGTGLGAFQARQYTRSMGGRLEVDSLPGKGTTMSVRLRLETAGVDEQTKQEGLA